jgi:hypothetical protein
MSNQMDATSRTGAAGRAETEIGWRRSGERAGFSLIAAVAAFAGGFFLVPLLALSVFNSSDFWPGRIFYTFLLLNLVLVPVAVSVSLARRSRISLGWLVWPLLGAVAAGAIGFIAWFASMWEPMD